MGVEDGAVDLWQPLMDTGFERLDLLDRALYRHTQVPDLGFRIRSATLSERVEVDLRMDEVGLADTKARRGTDSG